MSNEISKHLKMVFEQIAEEYELKIDTIEVIGDHVHIFVEVPLRYSPAQVVQILKSVSAHDILKGFPELRKQPWAGKFWNDGYFVRSVGDKVTADIICKYIEYQTHQEHPLQQLLNSQTYLFAENPGQSAVTTIK